MCVGFLNHPHEHGLIKAIKGFIKESQLHDMCDQGPHHPKVTISSPSKVQGPLTQQMWVQRLLHQARGIMGFFNNLSHARGPLWSRYIKTSHVGLPDLLLGTHDIIIAWMTTEWVINASSTHLGLLQHPSRLQNHLQGLQHDQQGLQHLQQGRGIKIQSCGYIDLVNWVQGASRHKPTL